MKGAVLVAGLLTCASAAVAFGQATGIDSLRFEDYPATDTLRQKPAPVNLRSYKLATQFRTVLRNGAGRGPNFAGAFTIVTWGCGSSCRILAVVSARSGRVYGPWLQYQVAVAYRYDSRLLLVDSPDSVRAVIGRVDQQCAVCGTPGACVWDQDHFQPLVQGGHEVTSPR